MEYLLSFCLYFNKHGKLFLLEARLLLSGVTLLVGGVPFTDPFRHSQPTQVLPSSRNYLKLRDENKNQHVAALSNELALDLHSLYIETMAFND